MRPARLSAALAALFPAGGVLGAELHDATAAGRDFAESARPDVAGAARAQLTQAEWQAIRHCRQVRIRDFTAGRMCARRALRELGVQGGSLLAAADRRPLWPAGVVGSITHTQGYSAAVVARVAAIASLGIDSERISAVHPRLWPFFCTSGELEWLWRLSADERPQAAALVFAAKEAYFKCQYPLVREPLGFDAVQLEALGSASGQAEAAGPCVSAREIASAEAPASRGGRGGRFRMLLQKGQLRAQLSGTAARPVRLEGRYRLHGPFITVAVALPAAVSPPREMQMSPSSQVSGHPV
jgi:4'-phosphopantetheinyl transferase EntD